MPHISEEDLFIFNELKSKFRQQSHVRMDGPDPAHRGVVDQGYVPGSDVREFPKMAYKQDAKEPKGYRTRIIETEPEQASAVKNGWLVQTKDIHALLDGIAREKNGAAVEAA